MTRLETLGHLSRLKMKLGLLIRIYGSVCLCISVWWHLYMVSINNRSGKVQQQWWWCCAIGQEVGQQWELVTAASHCRAERLFGPVGGAPPSIFPKPDFRACSQGVACWLLVCLTFSRDFHSLSLASQNLKCKSKPLPSLKVLEDSGVGWEGSLVSQKGGGFSEIMAWSLPWFMGSSCHLLPLLFSNDCLYIF